MGWMNSTIQINATFENCSCNYKHNDEIVEGKRIEIIADEGYFFNGNSYEIVDSFSYEYFKITEDKTILYYDPQLEYAEYIIQEDIKADKKPVSEFKKIQITGELKNCTCNYVNDEKLSKTKNIIITCETPFYFSEGYTLLINGVETPYVLAESKTELIYETSNITTDTTVEITSITPSETPQAITPFIRIYTPSDDELKALSEYRFKWNQARDDLFSYVTMLYITPLGIPTELINPKENIIIADFETPIQSNILNDYQFNYKLGVVKVPFKHNNLLDYVNTECILQVPFIENIMINASEVINKTIEVYINYCFYTGTGTLNILSNGVLIDTREVNIMTNYPYILKNDSDVEINTVLENIIDNVQIKVTRNVPISVDSYETLNHWDYISKYTYVECSEIELNGFTGVGNELQEIENILNGGVYIEKD